MSDNDQTGNDQRRCICGALLMFSARQHGVGLCGQCSRRANGTQTDAATSDAALLALIVGDHASISVLAAWAALQPRLAELDDPDRIAELGALIDLHETHVRSCLRKLVAARVLRDHGISELADKLLQTHVQAKLTGGAGRRRR